MSQKRQEARDRLRAENDYRVNLKAELEIRHLHEKIDHLLTKQWERLAEIQQIQLELLIYVRLRAVSLVNGQEFEMPITQAELGDATGLSTVHVNRTLQELRGNGLITTPKSGRVVIEDWDGLQKAGEFDATYLHLKKQAA